MLAFVTFIALRRSGADDLARTCFWVGLVGVVLMFMVNIFLPREKEAEVYYHDESGGDDSFAGRYMARQRAKAQVFAWCLLTGPRLLSWSIFCFKRSARLKRQDTHSCAAVVWTLFTKGKRLSYDEIQREVDWLDLDTTMHQIAWLPGLIFVNKNGPAVSLSEELRSEVRQELLGAPSPELA